MNIKGSKADTQILLNNQCSSITRSKKQLIKANPVPLRRESGNQSLITDRNILHVLNKFVFFLFFVFIFFLNLLCLLVFPYFIRKPLELEEN